MIDAIIVAVIGAGPIEALFLCCGARRRGNDLRWRSRSRIVAGRHRRPVPTTISPIKSSSFATPPRLCQLPRQYRRREIVKRQAMSGDDLRLETKRTAIGGRPNSWHRPCPARRTGFFPMIYWRVDAPARRKPLSRRHHQPHRRLQKQGGGTVECSTRANAIEEPPTEKAAPSPADAGNAAPFAILFSPRLDASRALKHGPPREQ